MKSLSKGVRIKKSRRKAGLRLPFTSIEKEKLLKEILKIVAKIPEEKAIIIKNAICKAYFGVDVSHDFEDLTLNDDILRKKIKKACSHGEAFLNSLPVDNEVYRGIEKNVEVLKNDISNFLNKLKEVGTRLSVKKGRGRKSNMDLWLIVQPLADGYFKAFNRLPTVSKNSNSKDKRGDFCAIFDKALKLITGTDIIIEASTLSGYLQRWKKQNKHKPSSGNEK